MRPHLNRNVSVHSRVICMHTHERDGGDNLQPHTTSTTTNSSKQSWTWIMQHTCVVSATTPYHTKHCATCAHDCIARCALTAAQRLRCGLYGPCGATALACHARLCEVCNSSYSFSTSASALALLRIPFTQMCDTNAIVARATNDAQRQRPSPGTHDSTTNILLAAV